QQQELGMAGHSKFANIKHRKAAQDAKRGKVFTKLIREIVVAARNGGAAPEDNPTLRSVMDKAFTANMKKDTIEKAIARGAGNNDADNYEALTYEGYGASGVAMLVKCLSDNKNRTVSEVRHAFSKHGGNLGTDGSVAYLFNHKGQLYIESDDEEAIMELALEAGAEDVINHGENSFEIRTEPTNYLEVKAALSDAGYDVEGEVSWLPDVEVDVDGNTADKVQRLIDTLEESDDVQNVYTNAAFPEPEAE
ncbi:MAG: YebC/PmpR family DNA-binding transcriptional regulator, partial [Natronospirillum sp.]